MDIRLYPAIVERGICGFGVSFPDFPGCVSAGDTFDEAVRSAAEALAFHVEGMRADGEPIPDPSDLAAAPRDPEVDEVARVRVPLALADGGL